jgi:hypothetical protein
MQYKLIPLETARWRLAVVWFSASGLVLLLMVGQSLGGVYGDKLQSAWAWALPNFIPTLALMVSVFAADAFRPYDETRGLKVREPFFNLSFGLSLFYLALLLLTILVQPIVLTVRTDAKLSSFDILEMSNLWLGPMQGIVVAGLGVLFFLKEDGPGHTQVNKKPKQVPSNKS